MPSPLYDFLASKRFSRYLQLILLFGDLVLLNTAYVCSVYLRFGNMHKLAENEVQTVWVLSNAAWIILTIYYDIHKLVRIHRIEQFVAKTLKALLLHVAFFAFLLMLLKFHQISRLRIFYFYVLFLIGIILARYITLRVLKHLRKSGYNFREVIIVGYTDNAKQIIKTLRSDLTFGYKIIGVFCHEEIAADSDIDYLGNLNQIQAYLEQHKVHEIYVALPDDEKNRISQLIQLAEKHLIRIKFVPNFGAYTKSRHVNIDFYGNLPVLMLRPEPLELGFNRLSKKIFDVAFSLLVILLVLSWLFPILMICIKLSSKGPVFFKQKRSGEDNKEFTCLKFRTMRVNTLADELQATKNDPRITKLGAFMRKTNLDELPQFFNVLWGNMSVVGPRPHMVRHTEEYSALINEYLVRHFAKPGITGWAQINGYRGETKELIDMKKRIEFDIWYIENWSFLLDLKIILLTVWNMLKGEKNAY